MRILLAMSALLVAFAAAPVAATAGVRIVADPPAFRQPSPGGLRHAALRDAGGDHDFWRHHHRQGFAGLIGDGAVAGAVVEPGPEPTPSPFVVAVPVFVNVAFAPAAGPQRGWTDDGPKVIEIGRGAPPRRHLPLVVTGD